MKNLNPDKQHKIMTQTPVFKLILKMSVPTVLAQLMTVIYNMADTWFVSQISTSASGAVGIVYSVMAIIQAFGLCICMGCQNLISIRLGEKRNNEAETIAVSSVIMSVILGLFVTCFGLMTLKPLMRALGSTETMLPYCCDYGKWIFISAPVMCGAFVLNAILRAEGLPNVAMVGLTFGGLLNVILDPIFINKYGMGISGAGLSTAISQCISFILLLIPFYNGKSILKLKMRNAGKSFGTYKEIVMTGIPTFFRQSMGSLSSTLLNRQARLFGDAAIAAVTVGSRIYMLIRNVTLGVGQAYIPVAGYNYGAKKFGRTKQAFTFACIFGTVICVGFAIPLWLYADEIIGLFRDDPQVIAIGSLTLKCFVVSLPVLAYSTFVNHFYQCLGFKVRATFLACLRQGIIFIPALYILTRYYGLFGVQSVQAISDILTFFVSVPFQIHIFKNILNKKERENGKLRKI